MGERLHPDLNTNMSLIRMFHQTQSLLDKSGMICRQCANLQSVWTKLYSTQTQGKSYNRTVPVDPASRKQMKKLKPEQFTNSKQLKVAIIGAPNVGKSTLANRLMGWRFAAASKKVHTTRKRALGVYTEGDSQIVLLDTPGMILPQHVKKHNLEKSLLTDPHSVLFEADLIAVVVDVSNAWYRLQLDHRVLQALHIHNNKPSVLILNKVDLLRSKIELLHSARMLTEGTVGGKTFHQVKPTHKKYPKLNSMSIIEKYASEILPEDKKVNLNKLQYSDSEIKSTQIYDNESDENVTNDHISVISNDDDTVIEVHMPHGSDELDLANQNTEYFESSNQSSADDHAHNTEEADEEDKDYVDLRDPNKWQEYWKMVQKIGRKVEKKRGWNKFDQVFMVSALDGDGVVELRDYLLSSAQPGPWLFHSSVVTSESPIDVAVLCVWERMLDNLPEEIPYKMNIRLTNWLIDDDNMLRASFDLVCTKKRHLYHSLGKDGKMIKKIAAEAKQELMNTFRREMSLKLIVKYKPEIHKR